MMRCQCQLSAGGTEVQRGEGRRCTTILPAKRAAIAKYALNLRNTQQAFVNERPPQALLSLTNR